MAESAKEREKRLVAEAVELLSVYQPEMDILDAHRVKALRAYKSEPYGNEIDGRSKVVMSDVADTVEWIMPSLMRIFYGGGDVVSVRPQGAEDEPKVALVEQKLNFDFTRQNQGFLILHDWFKDALLYRNGFVKRYWDKKETYRKREYKEIDQAEFLALSIMVEQGKFIIDSQEEMVIDDGGGMTEPLVIYNVKGREVTKVSKPCIENLHPSEIIYDAKAKHLHKSRLVAHRLKKHRNHITSKYDIKDADISEAYNSITTDLLLQEMYKDLGGAGFLMDDRESKMVYLYECYMIDYDDNGEELPVKFMLMGDRILKPRKGEAIEENAYKVPPFRDLTPIRMTHAIGGRSFFDLIGELQKLHTALMRHILDNIYYQTNGVKFINPYVINVDDYISNNVPGGLVRTLVDRDPAGGVWAAPVTPLDQPAFGMLEVVAQVKENRSGVSRLNQGLNPQALNDTASGVNQIMTASQQRIEMIARIFAETGVKGLFQDIVDMNMDFFDIEQNVKLNEEWQTITPESISGLYDIEVDVAIGTGSKDIKVQQMLQMINTYLMATKLNAIVPPEKVFAMLREIWHAWGYKNADSYVPSEEEVEDQQTLEQVVTMLIQQMQSMGIPIAPQIMQLLQGGQGGMVQEQGGQGAAEVGAGSFAETSAIEGGTGAPALY